MNTEFIEINVHTGSFDPEASQMAKSDLFDNLDNNETLRNSEEYFFSFYSDNEDEPLGMQSKVRSSMKMIYNDNNRQAIALNDSLITVLIDKKSVNDSLLLAGGLSDVISSGLIIENTLLIQTINSLIQETNNLLKLTVENNYSLVEASKTLNDEVEAITTIELNEQKVNDIYIRNLALGIYSIDSTDLNTLLDIAEQCPFLGGKGVYKARANLAVIGYYTEYDDISACIDGESLRKSSLKSGNHIYVRVSPNPLMDVCKFAYNLPKDESATLNIFDCYGNDIFHSDLSINSTFYSLTLENFTNGIYFYSVNTTSGLVGNGKIVLIK